MVREVEEEIARLHRFFEDWFNGRLDVDAFGALEEALGDGFVLVSPRGVVDDRRAILDSVRRAHGRDGEPIRIWIENTDVRHVHDGWVVATYEEWQQTGDDEARGRLSTVLFSGAPDQLVWRHVHETWLPTDEG